MENHLFLWAMASMAMLNNQRVVVVSHLGFRVEAAEESASSGAAGSMIAAAIRRGVTVKRSRV